MLKTGLLRTENFLIAASLSLFVFLKYGDISLPYFWDEMSGYVSGMFYMYDHGISLHPAAVPPQMSYGHPLLMHALLALWMKVLGTEVEVLHTATLAFTFLAAIATYKLAFFFSKDRQVSSFAFMIFLLQPVVLAQSTQVVLEMFLCMLCTFALYCYTKERFVAASLLAIAAVLTKETGLVLAVCFISQIILEWFRGLEIRKAFSKLALFSLPFLAFGIFLMLQKQTHGWYLNPINVGKSRPELSSMVQKLWDYPLEFTFINQGRVIYTISLILILFVLYLRKAPLKAGMNMNTVLILLFCLGFSLFSSIADTLERYFLLLIPFVSILYSYFIVQTRVLKQFLPLLLLMICLSFSFFNRESGEKYTEVDLAYRHIIYTSRDIFNFTNSGAYSRDTVGFAFPLQYTAADPRYGYYRKLNFISDTAFLPATKYKVWCRPGNMDWNPPDTQVYKLIRAFHSSYSSSYLYKKTR